jgi:diacylglycerol kinase family enzyme
LVAVALVLLGVARNVLAVVGAGLSLLVCVASGWYVVSRHGRARLTAVAAMAVALALVVVALLVADVSILRVTLAGALAAHLKSGGGKAERFRLAEECRKRDIEPVVLQLGDDLRQLAEDAVRRGADVLGMAGGDGSQALVAAVAARHDIGYVCVPAGTRNHFPLDLGLDREDAIGSLDAFAGGYERHVDLATVNGRTFVNNASLGLYADVVESPQYRDAKIKTAASKLPDLLGPDAAPVDLPFTGPDGASHPTAQLILVSNNPYQPANAGGRGTRQHIDRGVLGIVTARITGAAEASRFAALEVVGQVRRFTGWLEWTAREFEIRSAGPVRIGVDGETIEMTGPLKFAGA